MKIIFMGTSDFSLKPLQSICGMDNFDLVAVYTRMPKPAGRKMELKKSVVHKFAEDSGVRCLTPKTFRDPATIEEFKSLAADVVVVAAYGLIIPQEVLNIPKYGFINIHGSLLPRWRGASPMQATLLNGDKKSGITIMKMDAGIDTGDIISMKEILITPKMNLKEFSEKMSNLGANMIVDVLNGLPDCLNQAYPQPEEGASYTGKISTEDCRINWNESAENILHKIMGLSPIPAAWTEIAGIRMKVLDADIASFPVAKKMILSCRDGHIELTAVQPAGKKVMTGEDFMRGHQGIDLDVRL